MKRVSWKTKISAGIILSFLSIVSIEGQGRPPQDLGKNQWIVAIQFGTAMIGTEMTPGLQALKSEFNNQPGASFDFSLSHTLFNHWEFGVDIERNYLNGNSALPGFSANGVHPRFMDIYPQPVYYQTVSTSYYTFARYYFRPFPAMSWSKSRLDPFVGFGVGANCFKTLLNYETMPPGASTDNIFLKGQGWNPMPGSSARYNIGTGVRIDFKSKLNLLLSFDIDLINSDCLDAVHNYDASGKRLNAFTLLTRLRMGVILPISHLLRKGRPYMPWTP